jgi:hypothetical protein
MVAHRVAGGELPLSGVNVKNLPNPCSLPHPPAYCSRR